MAINPIPPTVRLALMTILCGLPSGGSLAEDLPAENMPAENAASAPITGPRELLRRWGIDDSCFARLIDGRPVGDDENETLLKVLFRIRGFAKTDLQRWARPELNLPELLRDPEAPRGEVFRLSGRVASVEVRRPLAEVVERCEFDRYYRCEFLLGEDEQPAVIFARNVPKAWREGGSFDEPSGALGVLLKFAGDAERPTPVFVAPRVAWYPDTLLGRLGMDVGLLDDLVDRKGLTSRDREAFYQMHAAMARAEPGKLLRDAKKQLQTAADELKRTDKEGDEYYSVVPLFNRPAAQRGRLVALRGTVRRVVRVGVGDEDIRERFGIDHYYNIYLFPDDAQHNPVVFSVRELPPGMPTGDGPDYGEYCEVAGFFFKSWAYRAPSAARGPDSPGGRRRVQLAPLLIGRRPVWFPRQPPSRNALFGAIAGGLFVVVLLGVWLAVWAYGRGDKKFHDRTLAKQFTLDSGVSLNNLDLDADGKPDFKMMNDE